jgi:hypothetical protein
MANRGKSASHANDRLRFSRNEEMSDEKWKLKNAKRWQLLLARGMLKTRRLVRFEFFSLQ